MCLQDQGIDDNDGGVRRLRWARGLSNDDGGVRRERGIYDASEGSETTAEVERIWGQRRRLQHQDHGPDELTTKTEASAD